MINEAPLFKDPDIRIPIIIPIKEGGVINKGSTLVFTLNPKKLQ